MLSFSDWSSRFSEPAPESAAFGAPAYAPSGTVALPGAGRPVLELARCLAQRGYPGSTPTLALGAAAGGVERRVQAPLARLVTACEAVGLGHPRLLLAGEGARMAEGA